MDWQAATAFWQWGDSELGKFHLYAALVAMAVGPIVFFLRKGNVAHRLFGLVYVIAMFTTNLSALSLYEFTGTANFFHIAAIFSLLTVIVGVVAIVVYGASRSKLALDLHLQMMPWSYFGLLLAALAEAGTRGLPRLFDDAANFWTPFFIFMAIAGVIGGVWTAALIKPVRRRWLELE